MDNQESLLSAINEKVVLRPYDPCWPERFDEERARLISLFPDSFIDIQHIGSTAIPGMTAKPIIDILAGVETMAVADALVEPLCRNAYTTSTEFNATLSDRRWLMRWADGCRTHHLHIVVADGNAWHRHIRFRDVLRADAPLAERYLALKEALAVRFKEDREAYTDAKAIFVEAALENLQ